MRGVALVLLLLLPGSVFAYAQTIISSSGGGRPSTVFIEFTGIPDPQGDGLLTVSGVGDIGGVNEVVRVDLVPGGLVGYLFGDLNNGLEPIREIDTLLIPQADLEAAIIDGALTLALIVEPNSGVSVVNYDYLRLDIAEAATVPEPSSIWLVGAAFVAMLMTRSGIRRKTNNVNLLNSRQHRGWVGLR